MQFWNRLARHMGDVFLGGQRLFTFNSVELTTRTAAVAFGTAPILFVCVELSPSAWGIIAPILLAPVIAAANFHISRSAVWIVVAAAIFSLSTAMWSIDPSRSVKVAINIAGYGIAGVVLVSQVRALSQEQVTRAWNVLVIGCFLALGALLFYEVFVAFRFQSDWKLVEQTRTLHKVTLYGFVAAAVLVADAGFKGKRSVLPLILFAIPTFLLGRSSGVSFSIIAVTLFYAVRQRDVFLILFVTAFVVSAGLAPFFINEISEEARPFWSAIPPSFTARLDLWQMISGRVLSAPLIGHGIDTLRVSPWVIEGAKFYDLPDIPSAHNVVFDIWYDVGLVGVVLLSATAVSLVRYCLGLSGHVQLLAGALLLVVVIEFSVDHRIWISWVQGFFVFIAGVMALATRMQAVR